MPAVKKTQLYSKLWDSCDDLRGGMDASEYKNYILTLLFMKYVSDKYSDEPFSQVIIPKGGSFQDMLDARNQPDIGERIDKIIERLISQNQTLKGVIDLVSFNDPTKLGSGKEMVDKLSQLLSNFETLNFKKNQANDDDLLGDAYEYLMRKFATESGKSKGQFYTPAEVSRVLAKVVGVGKSCAKSITIYDPACGSGSLLIKAAKEASVNVSIYGQEKETTTAGLAKMNMFLHNFTTAEVRAANTLSEPQYTNDVSSLKQFDYVVVNPPFSLKSWTQGVNCEKDPFGRWSTSLAPPAKNGDYAWLLHVLRSMKETGRAAVILPHGVLFRGNAEETIRRYFIDNGFIEGVVGLPSNLFYGTPIPACIVILDKKNAAHREGIFMIDASTGFVKDGSKNRLRESDIKRIVDTYEGKIEIPKYSRFVPLDEIRSANEYNLNIPRYIDSSAAEVLQNIDAHLRGWIPADDVASFKRYWSAFPSLLHELFHLSSRDGFYELAVSYDAVADTVSSNADFIRMKKEFAVHIERFSNSAERIFMQLKPGFVPESVVDEVSSALFAEFSSSGLVDVYDVYQAFMEKVVEHIRDELYLISDMGYYEACRLADWEVKVDKKGKEKRTGVILGAVIPSDVISAVFFADDEARIAKFSDELEFVSSRMQELSDEDGEDGILSEVAGDKKSVSKSAIVSRLKEAIDKDDESVLRTYLGLIQKSAELSAAIKKNTALLTEKVMAKYGELSDDDGRDVLIKHHWLSPVCRDIAALFDTLVQELEDKIIELAKRYETKLSTLAADVEDNEKKVLADLKRMGFEW